MADRSNGHIARGLLQLNRKFVLQTGRNDLGPGNGDGEFGLDEFHAYLVLDVGGSGDNFVGV